MMKILSEIRLHNFILAGIVLTGLVVGSCKSDHRPEYVLDQQTMVRTLADIYIMEEKVRRLALTTDSTAIVFEKLQRKVFESEKLDDSVFRKSMDYYMGHPKEMQEIYTALVDSLNLREQRESVKTKEEQAE